tara:strand:+ start:156 stop:359 length:204 start_codon:yes stop_codon:yes gene_type:complete
MARTAKPLTSKEANKDFKTVKGVPVVPVMYVGRQIGHGNYMAGTLNGVLVTDTTGRPVSYKTIVKDR